MFHSIIVAPCLIILYFKGLVHLKIEIQSLITHPHVVPNP